MPSATEKLQRLQQIAATDGHPLHRTAVNALRKLDQATARARRPEKTAHAYTRLGKYQVNGVWKLTERIADYDAEGGVVNGPSDRTSAVSTGRTLRPASAYSAPTLAPQPVYEEKPGWAGVQRNAADSSVYRAHGIVQP